MFFFHRDFNGFQIKLLQISNGISYLHENDLVHGDLRSVGSRLSSSPSQLILRVSKANIVVENNMALLVDYGLPSDVRRKQDTLEGKQFEAPEMWSLYHYKDEATEECDVYALGMTFYEVFCL